MEQDSSFNDQLRKEITARAVMNKKINMFKENIDENNKKIDNINKEINRIKKVLRERIQKKQTFSRSLFKN